MNKLSSGEGEELASGHSVSKDVLEKSYWVSERCSSGPSLHPEGWGVTVSLGESKWEKQSVFRGQLSQSYSSHSFSLLICINV